MSLSNTVKAALLDAYFNSNALSPPATVYVGLSSTAPSEDGTNVTEPSSGSYARVEVDNDGTAWNDATDADPSVKDNASAITFPESTGAWLTGSDLTHFVIYDAASAGNYVGGGSLDTARSVDASGITLEFSAGELDISLT